MIALQDEPSYVFGSVGNVRLYPSEWLIDKEDRPSSRHGVLIDGELFAVIGACGGSTGIHGHSLLQQEDSAYIAVGDQVVSLDLKEKEMRWSLKIDEATCLGVYYAKEHDALISHGELLISRFSSNGRILWQSGGSDIFTKGFSLLNDCIHVIDFEGAEYRFSYEDGKEKQD
ncbi:MAG: hypothetical protein AAF492_00100 [Verrucomicrobiota bacterium]